MPALWFADLLGIALPPSRPYQTFAGFLLQEFGTIPGVGDKIEADGWRFEIVDLDGTAHRQGAREPGGRRISGGRLSPSGLTHSATEIVRLLWRLRSPFRWRIA